MISFHCPACNHPHLWPEQAKRACVWCACGLILKIGGDDGQTPIVSRPDHPKLVSHPQQVQICGTCFQVFQSVELMHGGEKWFCQHCGLEAVYNAVRKR